MVLWDDYYGNGCRHCADVRDCPQCSPRAAEDTAGGWVLILVIGAVLGAILAATV